MYNRAALSLDPAPLITDQDRVLRRRLFLAALPVPVLCAIGVYAFWPIIVPELARRDGWEIITGGAEGVVAAYWYFRFIVGSLFKALRTHHTVAAVDQAVAQWRRIAISILCGAILSALSMALTFHTEKSAYRSGTKAIAQARVLKTLHFTNIVHYRLECHFEDAIGAEHIFKNTAVDGANDPPSGYPPEVVKALRNGLTVLPIPLRYDPANPARAWVEGTGGLDGNATLFFSLTILMFQMMGLALFALCFLPALRAQARHGRIPWWADIYKIMPLAVESVFLGLFGCLELFLNDLR